MTLDVLQGEADVLAQVDAAIAAAPDSVAVHGPDGTLTYSALSARADDLARRLRETGVEAGQFVGVCVDRSAALVVAVLGVVRAGAAYVAIDPKYPAERVAWMLDDAQAVAVVTTGAVGASAARPAITLAAAGALPGGATGGAPLPGPPGPGDVAYVVYTSGSSGLPKGVPVDHAALANLVAWHNTTFGLSGRDRCTQIASPGFDAAVWEIWPSLAAGARIHVVPEALRVDAAGLRDWLVGEGITVSFLPTAIAETVIGLEWPAGTALRHLLTGGDALTRRPAPGLGFTVVNNYGLSETAVVATSGEVDPYGRGAPSIGRAIPGIAAEVLDDEGLPVPDGTAGELVLGGVAVARGYLNRPELTQERFFPDGRYRTGDRVRVRPDGALDFLGRLDDQLSIRGFRVEPGEVAAALNDHPGVAASVAAAVGRSGSERQLVAYVVAAGPETPPSDALDMFMRTRVPDHLVPSKYVWLDALPMTEHGKIDRAALPLPTAAIAVPAGRQPETEVELAIAEIVATLLELEVAQIGVDQNFFLLGGHSMLGAQLVARLDAQYGAEVTLRFLFDHPTLAAIAAEVERQIA